jgi:uncharacterized membrane protein (UPF0127 family)
MQNKETVKTASVRRQKNPILFIAISLILVFVMVGGFLYLRKDLKHVEYKDVKIGSQVFRLEIADTQASREKGLSEREPINKNTGMLFDFKKYGDWRMWMVQMRFNIDIIWLNKEGEVLHIKKNAIPGSYPETYYAEQPSWYVIELLAGEADKNNIKEGNIIKIN